MNLKHFYIRLNKEHVTDDEATLNDFMESVYVSKTSTQFVSVGNVNYWSILIFYKPAKEDAITENEIVLDEYETARYETLRKWRNEMANGKNVPAYIIMHNSVLKTIARTNPSTVEEMLDVKGIGHKLLSTYGSDIIAVLNSL